MVEAPHQGLGVVALPLSDAVVSHQGQHAVCLDRAVPGSARLTRVLGQQGGDPAIMEPTVVGQEAAHSPFSLEAERPGDLPGGPVGHRPVARLMDVAAPPQRGQGQGALRIEGHIDKGRDGAGHGAAPARRSSEPVADLAGPSALGAAQGDAEHTHQVRTGTGICLADRPGELTPLAPALGHDLLDEELGVAALIVAGDEGPLLNVRILANLGDAVEVVSGGDRQDQCGQVAVSSNGHLKGVHEGRC